MDSKPVVKIVDVNQDSGTRYTHEDKTYTLFVVWRSGLPIGFATEHAHVEPAAFAQAVVKADLCNDLTPNVVQHARGRLRLDRETKQVSMEILKRGGSKLTYVLFNDLPFMRGAAELIVSMKSPAALAWTQLKRDVERADNLFAKLGRPGSALPAILQMAMLSSPYLFHSVAGMVEAAKPAWQSLVTFKNA